MCVNLSEETFALYDVVFDLSKDVFDQSEACLALYKDVASQSENSLALYIDVSGQSDVELVLYKVVKSASDANVLLYDKAVRKYGNMKKNSVAIKNIFDVGLEFCKVVFGKVELSGVEANEATRRRDFVLAHFDNRNETIDNKKRDTLLDIPFFNVLIALCLFVSTAQDFYF